MALSSVTGGPLPPVCSGKSQLVLVPYFIGKGNGTPLQYSCQEDPMDRGAWWATCSPWGHYMSDTTEQLHFHCSLSCTPKGMDHQWS